MLHLFCAILQINFVLSLKIHIMIQANELRIGDWVKVKGTNNAITVSFPLHNKLAEDWYSFLNAIEPIPLTPEILEKAGFEKSIYSGEYIILCGKETKSNGLFICLNIDDNYSCSIGQLKHFSHQFGEYKYLHQLQNLYFALTNTELNIEL